MVKFFYAQPIDYFNIVLTQPLVKSRFHVFAGIQCKPGLRIAENSSKKVFAMG